MNKSFIFTLLAVCISFSGIQAQIKKGFKYLESREFESALTAFQKDFDDPEKGVIARFGIMKTYTNSKELEEWYLAIELYKETSEMFAALEKDRQKDLTEDYNMTKSSIDNTYSSLYGKILNKIERSPTACEDIKRLLAIPTEAPKSVKTRLATLKTKCEGPKEPVKPEKPKVNVTYVSRTPPEGRNITFLNNINTNGNEAIPVLSSDGSIMYLLGLSRPDNIKGEDVFYSERQSDGSWGESRLEEFFSAKQHESVISASGDGNQLILFIEGEPYMSNRTKTGWGKPERIKLKVKYPWVGTVNISRNGDVLFFEARSSVTSDINIYVALKDPDGSWGYPTQLDETINTSGNDRSPFLHSDFKTLYFSSERENGYGKLDIYKSTRLDDTWKRWSKPENIGGNINSEADDWSFFIPPSGDIAYFTTKFPGNFDSDIVSAPLEGSARPEAQMVVKGKLTDTKGTGLPGEITVEDAITEEILQKLRSRPDGSYSFSIPSSSKVYYYASGDSVITTEKTYVDAAAYSNAVKEENLKIITIDEILKENKTIQLHDILFETGRAVLQYKSKLEIKRVYEAIKKYGWDIEIGGHTDNVGGNSQNQTLSEQRAKTVSDYLISLGYPSAKITSKGYGDTVPVESNDTESGRSLNRRVEIKVIK